MSGWNDGIIEEFRANAGQVGGMFEGATLLLLHHIGAKSRAERISPLMYQDLGNGYAVFASKGGADTNPDWYHNLMAHPDIEVEVGAATVEVTAREVAGEERERIWSKQKAERPQFGEYERKTDRTIPVIVLEPR